MLFQNTVTLKKCGVANFADIIKVVITLTEKTFRKSAIVKRIPSFKSKYNSYLYFPI